MIKILFLIPNLSHGGAEKVLVNLVNNMDKNQFDVTVMTLFAGGVNEQFLNSDIKYKYCFKKSFRGNSKLFCLFSPKQLFKRFIKGKYNIIVSYLEGPTARIVSGCNDKSTKLVCWIHIEQHTKKRLASSFRNYTEAQKCYERFNNIICVSEYVKNDFINILDYKGNADVLYNTNETAQILKLSEDLSDTAIIKENEINICVVGKIIKRKGCYRICQIQKKLLSEGFNTHIYFLGEGPEEIGVVNFAKANKCEDSITLLGYQTNPYKYIKKCDLFVCASFVEGFSTAATEALIVGTPIVTVEVSGMKEMLGENNEFGVVTENNDIALYEGIKTMISTDGMLEDYARRAKERGKFFSTKETVKAVENMLKNIEQ